MAVRVCDLFSSILSSVEATVLSIAIYPDISMDDTA